MVKIAKKNREKRSKVNVNESEMIYLCTAKPAIASSSWCIPANTGDQLKTGDREMIDKFEKDLESFAYGLPPRFSDMGYWYKMVFTVLELSFITSPLTSWNDTNALIP